MKDSIQDLLTQHSWSMRDDAIGPHFYKDGQELRPKDWAGYSVDQFAVKARSKGWIAEPMVKQGSVDWAKVFGAAMGDMQAQIDEPMSGLTDCYVGKKPMISAPASWGPAQIDGQMVHFPEKEPDPIEDEETPSIASLQATIQEAVAPMLEDAIFKNPSRGRVTTEQKRERVRRIVDHQRAQMQPFWEEAELVQKQKPPRSLFRLAIDFEQRPTHLSLSINDHQLEEGPDYFWHGNTVQIVAWVEGEQIKFKGDWGPEKGRITGGDLPMRETMDSYKGEFDHIEDYRRQLMGQQLYGEDQSIRSTQEWCDTMADMLNPKKNQHET